MIITDKNRLPYMVGGLMYTPAINTGVADKLEEMAYPYLTSIAFCLEDSIKDEALEQAEAELQKTLMEIKAKQLPEEKRPLIFVRVRNPIHMKRVHELLHDAEDILTGYILPKFDLSNGKDYMELISSINEGRENPLYIMPILESDMIAGVSRRLANLLSIKDILDMAKEFVLNVRVGGNDLSNLYGLRRSAAQSIYDIGVIRDILADIINIFASDYVVSGPVWEYFGTDVNGEWAAGLRKELELDKLNGFTGKTAIHPAQLPLIYESLKVSRSDYEDALNILDWSHDGLGVAKSADGSRMNEVKCHGKWAERIVTLGQIYGIKEKS